MLASFLIFVADRAPRPLARGAAFTLGFLEGRGDVGMTWDDARSARSVAYDRGRTLRRRDGRELTPAPTTGDST